MTTVNIDPDRRLQSFAIYRLGMIKQLLQHSTILIYKRLWESRNSLPGKLSLRDGYSLGEKNATTKDVLVGQRNIWLKL
jgi:hypothetical protein